MATALDHTSRGKAPVSPRARTVLELLVLASFCAFFFFFGLGALGLVGADEPRYAQIAREMLARHDWVTPVLYGSPWMEKPILYYWEAMLSFRLFGVSDWAARLPSAVDASAMVFAVYGFVRHFGPRFQDEPQHAVLGEPGLNAGLIVASCAGIVGFGRAASTDMPLTAMFTIAILSWTAWLLDGRKLWLAVFYIFLALAALAKGPVAPFLAAVIILAYSAVRRDWKLIPRSLWWPGIMLFFAVAAPWYVAVQLANPNFFHFFILEQNLARFSTNVYHHPQPFWFYASVIPISVLPWLVLVIAGFFTALRTVFRIGQRGESSDKPFSSNEADFANFRLFCVLWALIPAVFFSLSQSKLPGYTLPVVPPLGLLAAVFLQRRVAEGRKSYPAAILHSAVVSAFLGGALLSAHFVVGGKPPASAWITAAILSAASFFAMLLLILLRGPRLLRIATLIPALVALTFVVRFTAPLIDMDQSARPVAKELAEIAPPNLKLAGYNIRRETEYGLAFYRNQPLVIYESGAVPRGEHVLVSQVSDPAQVPESRERTVRRIGNFGPQRLYFYWVGPEK